MATGTDRFGTFTVRVAPRPCECCGRTVSVTIGYEFGKLELPGGIDPRATIMRGPTPWVGLDCGCYGKLHRQVAHIMDRQRT